MGTFQQNVEQHHVVEFNAAVELALQQNASVFTPLVSHHPCEGEQSAYIHIFEPSTARRRTERKAENLDNTTERKRRWLIYQNPIHDGEYIDEEVLWRQAMDPTSSLIQTKTLSVQRAVDQVILEGMIGDAYEGKRGETTVPLPSAQKVGIQVGSGDTPANVGMNVKKLREAKKILRKSHALSTNEEPYIAITADEHDALFDFVEATSADYQAWDAMQRPAYRDGRLTRFMGFNFVEYEDLITNSAGTIRYIPCWTKSAVVKGEWLPLRSRLWNDSSRNQTPVFNIDTVCDARRTQDGRVVQIDCLIP